MLYFSLEHEVWIVKEKPVQQVKKKFQRQVAFVFINSQLENDKGEKAKQSTHVNVICPTINVWKLRF